MVQAARQLGVLATLAITVILDALSLDDIVTGSETDLRAEFLMIAGNGPIAAALLRRAIRWRD